MTGAKAATWPIVSISDASASNGGDLEPPAAWLSLVKDGRTHVLPSHLSDDQLAAQVARIALIEEEARLDRRIAKIGKLRKQVNKRLAA